MKTILVLDSDRQCWSRNSIGDYARKSLLAVICLILVQYTNSKREKVLFKPQRTSKATLIKSVSGRPPGWDYFTDLLGRCFFS